MREQYQGKDAKPLPPLVFAGIIMEGGIVGYDSNTLTGGAGLRIFGIGGSTQYQSDTVTVTLRTVSVSTGEILTTVTVTKTVLSYMDKMTLLRFVDDGTPFGAGANALEGELGGSINESINRAIDVAVQAAVVNTINEGARKGHWAFKSDTVISMPVPAIPIPPTEVVKIIKEEKKDELVQPPAKSETKTETVPSASPEVKKEEAGTELKLTPIQTGLKPTVNLFGARYLKEDSYVYKEANENSQRTWLLKKGTELTIITPGPEGWHKVSDSQKRSGFVKQDVLVNKP
jgi:hypothetical protein